ncbi:hypothetical protein [uncultured Desulfobacter sp.]|uniref:hypothetical protein n=1 Tax=uncultured Desulfobacter sp. TaxID=240139 RepID=UPI002AABC811|nr:hypothetical protein [uncultured Desulfobacter sp.]
MPTTFGDIVRFQDERLFEGAVNVDWLNDNPERAEQAAAAFVFHGPSYHGVTQAEVGTGHGHKLQDTAGFTHSIVRSCVGLSEKPFTLAIAGYGTGKSHLAITLASLLGDPGSQNSETIIRGIENADRAIGTQIRKLVEGIGKPCLVLSLNGMENYDLTAEMSRQILNQVQKNSADTSPMDNLRPRFKEAASRVNIMASNSELEQALLECTGLSDTITILKKLEQQNEQVYDALYPLFEQKGLRIAVHGGESLKDLIDVACREYCGPEPGKPFSGLLVLFDEFGRYAEFATMRRQIAGSGVLQHLFEGIQSNSDKATFVGFIQFELNSYIQRIAPEFKNDIIRVITRYQNADKAYLSTNLETLIAHLIEKKSSEYEAWFEGGQSLQASQQIMDTINQWFPVSKQHHLWTNAGQFHTVVRKGCWPLSPYAVWLLYYMSSAGKHLQERSALSLLSGRMKAHMGRVAVAGNQPAVMAATDLWSEELLQEFIGSEESGQQGTIAHSYATVINKHGSKLNNRQAAMLQAIVFSSKIGLSVQNREQAEISIGAFTGLNLFEIQEELNLLQNEFNIIEWDKNFQLFDILGDAVPRTQFLSFLRQRVASSFDEQGKAELFAGQIAKWCDAIGDLECDFSERNDITTKEWGYQFTASNLHILENHIDFAAKSWGCALGVADKRGSLIYCYVGPGEDIEKILLNTKRKINSVAKELEQKTLPIFVVFIEDETGDIGRMMAELAVLSDGINEQDKARFGHLVGSHEEKTRQFLTKSIELAVKERHISVGLQEGLSGRRLMAMGTELFSAIYKKPLPFPFDGYGTKSGNAAASCNSLTLSLLNGKLDFQTCSSLGAKDRNRSLNVLKYCWDCFNNTNGKIIIPKEPTAHAIVMAWRKKLDADDQQFIIADELRAACLPPFGANIASVGLLFGVFLSPRRDNVFILTDDGARVDVGQWLQQDLFKGREKTLDLDKIGKAEIINMGEESAEWENLLEDWELEESYQGRFQLYKQALALRSRIPISQSLTYKFVHLEELTKQSISAMETVQRKKDDAWDKIDKGVRHKNGGNIIWGAAEMASLLSKMEGEELAWTRQEKADIENDIGRARQMVIEIFPDWMPTQTLITDNPEQVGNFKHHLGSKVCKNLELLNLPEEAEQLKKWVNDQVKNSQVQAEAARLIQDVDSWLTENSEVFRIVRIAQIRSLLVPGKEYDKRLKTASGKVSLTEMDGIRSRVSAFIKNLKEAESQLSEKANALWDSKIQTYSDIAPLLKDIKGLMLTYEGCDTDLEDLELMALALNIFHDAYLKLQDTSLTWDAFKNLSSAIVADTDKKYGDNDPPPWDVEETLEKIIKEVSDQRKSEGEKWLRKYIEKENDIANMKVAEADAIMHRLQYPPAILTGDQKDKALKIAQKAKARCQELEVDWLVQKFTGLTSESQNIFLKKIKTI